MMKVEVTTGSKAETVCAILRWAGQMVAALVIFGTLLFLTACRLDWIPGWVYLGRNSLTQVLSAIILIPRRPEMLASLISVVGITALLAVHFKKVQPTSEVYHE